MKRCVWLVSLLFLVYTTSSCKGGSALKVPSTTTPLTTRVVLDQAELLTKLRSAGATAEVADTVHQDFFTPEGVLITIDDEEDIQVFEYQTAPAMEQEASQVAPDGNSVGTSMMMWVDNPHFYKSGRLIVLYLGDNPATLSLLNKVMGSQFAGQ